LSRDEYLAGWTDRERGPISGRRRLIDAQILNRAQLRRFDLRAGSR
jgi:hypothetical protein